MAEVSDSELPTEWTVVLSDEWDVLGPFPIHAREQHFLSPSYPLDLSRPIDPTVKWPSAYADGGHVEWEIIHSVNGTLHITYPNIRWASIRASEGWAALQHHSVLRTSIIVYPPTLLHEREADPPRLLIDVQQGTFFTVRPAETSPYLTDSFVPKWYAGNVYAMDAALPHAVTLPYPPSLTGPTKYELVVSGDYEIRLFGDPTVKNSEVPTLEINFGIAVGSSQPTVIVQEDHHVVPDFVDGWAFGEAFGIGLRSLSFNDWWTVQSVNIADTNSEGLTAYLLHTSRLAPTQTRIIPVTVVQSLPFTTAEILLEIHVTSPTSELTIPVLLPIKHLRAWDYSDYDPIASTYFYASSIPTAFISIPPQERSLSGTQTPLLFLHGAGVNVITHRSWVCDPARQLHSWIIIPTGRTAWGLDWHGPSTEDAWASVTALASILARSSSWKSWGFPKDTKVVLMGHSNGGQGAWHIAERYPDRVIAAIPAAAYSKAQSYISLVQSRSAHFVDPSIRAILETAFTPDDNDLFVTNLVNTPLLAIHGGADENVPVWHTRALVDTLKTWNANANVKFKEDPGQPHCYQSAFQNDEVQMFIDSAVASAHSQVHLPKSHYTKFTLTVAVPTESDALHGFRILRLETPGRLARLTVTKNKHGIQILPKNVAVFAVEALDEQLEIFVDGQLLEVGIGHTGHVIVERTETWRVASASREEVDISPAGRMARILSSPAPLHLIIPQRSENYTDIATRLAHDLDVYHKLDAEILDAKEALDKLGHGSLGAANIVTFGGLDNRFTLRLLQEGATPLRLVKQHLHLHGRMIDDELGSIFLHPHPSSRSSLALVLYANDEQVLERLLRLIPLRTGIAVPDWLLLSSTADVMGAGGVTGAGVWGNEWSWNPEMSSF